MKVTFTHSFEQTLLGHPEASQVKRGVTGLLQALEEGVKPKGLGLKKLRGPLWEIRISLHTRILFLLFPGEIRLVLIGNHDTVRRYLNN